MKNPLALIIAAGIFLAVAAFLHGGRYTFYKGRFVLDRYTGKVWHCGGGSYGCRDLTKSQTSAKPTPNAALPDFSDYAIDPSKR